MATEKTLKGRMQHPFLTETVLRTANPVLLAGEVVYESDTGKRKVGDGKTAWNSLAYEVAQLPNNIPASMISGDAAHRFVSDTEKSTWNNKAAKDLSNVSLTKLFSENGYYKAPDGLMFQWGIFNGVANSTGATVYFPTAFAYTPYSCVITPKNGADKTVVMGRVYTMTSSYFKATTVWATSGSNWGAEIYYWLAIGRWK